MRTDFFPLLSSPRRLRSCRGFTLIEILVVLALIGTLMLLVAPRYLSSVDRSKEVVLKENLFLVRDAIDKYFADNGRYPDNLQDLVSKKYLRRMPIDPITDSSTTWSVVAPNNGYEGALFDVHSGAAGTAADGVPYSAW